MSGPERKITQAEGDAFHVAVQGEKPDENGCVNPIVHHGMLVHEGGSEHKPLRHVLQIAQPEPHALSHAGEFRHRVDPDNPVPLDMRHSTADPLAFDLQVRDAQHALTVRSTLQDPVHHALQLKTPLQVRFVNPWHAQSDYTVSVRLGERTLLSIHATGTTTLTPEAAAPDPCLEPGASLRVRTLPDIAGRYDTTEDDD